MCEYLHHELTIENDIMEDGVETEEEVEKEIMTMDNNAAQAKYTIEKCVRRKQVEKNELIMVEEEKKSVC